MKSKILRIVPFIVGFLSGVGTVLIAMTYPRYHREMFETYNRVSAGSKICKTDYGDLEFAVKGDGQPVLLLHCAGGGYDQGLWFGRAGPGTGYKFVSVFFARQSRRMLPLSYRKSNIRLYLIT